MLCVRSMEVGFLVRSNLGSLDSVEVDRVRRKWNLEALW